MSNNDGGPAYPLAIAWDKAWSGMTLRDYFAGQALTGLVASFAGIDCNLPPPEKLAHDAYQQADAMLAHRGEGDE